MNQIIYQGFFFSELNCVLNCFQMAILPGISLSYHSVKGNILDKWAHINIKMNDHLDCIFSFVDRLCLRE